MCFYLKMTFFVLITQKLKKSYKKPLQRKQIILLFVFFDVVSCIY